MNKNVESHKAEHDLPDSCSKQEDIHNRRRFLRKSVSFVLDNEGFRQVHEIGDKIEEVTLFEIGLEEYVENYLRTIGESVLVAYGAVISQNVLDRIGIDSHSKGISDDHWAFFKGAVLTAPFLEEFAFRFLPSVATDISTNIKKMRNNEPIGEKDMHWKTGVAFSAAFGYAHGFSEEKFTMIFPFQQFMYGIYAWYLVRERGFDHSILSHGTVNSTFLARALLKEFPKK